MAKLSVYRVTSSEENTPWIGSASSREIAISNAIKDRGFSRSSITKIERRDINGNTQQMRGKSGTSGEAQNYYVKKFYKDGTAGAVMKRNLSEAEAQSLVRASKGGRDAKGEWKLSYDQDLSKTRRRN